MATEAGFPGNPFQETGGIKRRSSNANKRKRDSIDLGLAGARNPPNVRRTSAQYVAPATQQADDSPGADDSTIADLSGDSFHHPVPNGSTAEDPNAQFDFALQPSSSEAPMAQPATTSDSMGNGNNNDAAAAAMSQHYGIGAPQHPAEVFANQSTAEPDQGFNLEGSAEYQDLEGNSADLGLHPIPSILLPQRGKAPVGSDAWHKVRKDNHKEVERRRRETINEGINELSKIVPGCEKNKGSILQRAVQYIEKLHDEASQNIDKWTFEKLVTEQAINDLSAKLSRAWAEKEAWKRLAAEAGVDVDSVDLGIGAVGGQEGGVAAGTAQHVEGQGDGGVAAAAVAATVVEGDMEHGEGVAAGTH